MGSATSAVSFPSSSASTIPKDSSSATMHPANNSAAVAITAPERLCEAALDAEVKQCYPNEQARDPTFRAALTLIADESGSCNPQLNFSDPESGEGKTSDDEGVVEVEFSLAQFDLIAPTQQVDQCTATRGNLVDSSKSRSSQLHVSFTVALRFDDDTRSSDIDGGEVALLSSGPLSPHTLAGVVVGAEPVANCAAVVVPLTPEDVKHRMQQAVPRAARARNNRLRANSSRKQPQRPERHAFRLCGTLVSRDAQGPVPATNPLPNPHRRQDSP